VRDGFDQGLSDRESSRRRAGFAGARDAALGCGAAVDRLLVVLGLRPS